MPGLRKKTQTVINPLTNRQIHIGSKLYLKLCRNNVITPTISTTAINDTS